MGSPGKSSYGNYRPVSYTHLVKKQKYYVYRYEGKLNGIENAVVLLSYPEKAFGNPKDVYKRQVCVLVYLFCEWPLKREL